MPGTDRLRRLLQGAAVLAAVAAIAVQSTSSPILAQSSQAPPRTPPLASGAPPAAPAEATTQPSVAPRTASYDIDVTLDPPARTITGSEVIT